MQTQTKVKPRFTIKTKAQIKSKPTSSAAVALSSVGIDGKHVIQIQVQKREVTAELNRIRSIVRDRHIDLFTSNNTLQMLHVVYDDKSVFTVYRRPPYTKPASKKKYYPEKIYVR